MKYSTKNKGAWITGACLEFVSVLMLLLPFVGPSFVAVSLLRGGVSPVTGLLGAFVLFALGDGLAVFLGILYILLFLAAVVLPIVTGIMALVNRKYFTPLVSLIVYGVFCMIWILMAILVNTSASALLGSFGLGAGVIPTLWLFLGLGCVVAPMFLLKKHKEEIITVPPIPPVGPGGDDPDYDRGEVTIVASKSNRQGVQVQVRYTDDSGSHVVKRQIMTDRPMTVGRSDSCSVVLADGRASNVHARLKYDDLNGLVIEDNNSTNGIQVNGETIMKLRKISKEDSIRIGDSKLQFTVVGSLDDFDGERTIAAGDRYHEPVRVRLNFTDDSGPRVENVVIKETVMIGSMRECDVSVDSNTVSHKHARLVNLGNGRISVEDNASTNGVIVNGERIQRSAQVGKGDVITLGDVNIRIGM